MIVLSKQAILVRNPDLFGTELDDDLVMMDDANGFYYGLDSTARKIWELLEAPMKYQDLLESLVERFDVSFEECKRDVDGFVDDMITHKLLTIAV